MKDFLSKYNKIILISGLSLLVLALLCIFKLNWIMGMLLYIMFEFMYLLFPVAIVALICVLVFAIKGKYQRTSSILTVISMFSIFSLCVESCYSYLAYVNIKSMSCQIQLIGLLAISLLIIYVEKTKRIKLYIPISIFLILVAIYRLGIVIAH